MYKIIGSFSYQAGCILMILELKTLERKITASSGLAWSTEQGPGQPGLTRLSQKRKKVLKKKKTLHLWSKEGGRGKIHTWLMHTFNSQGRGRWISISSRRLAYIVSSGQSGLYSETMSQKCKQTTERKEDRQSLTDSWAEAGKSSFWPAWTRKWGLISKQNNKKEKRNPLYWLVVCQLDTS